MKETPSNNSISTPMLFPCEPEQFLQSIRQIIREEVQSIDKQKVIQPPVEMQGLTNKPLYKTAEVCKLFDVTKPTIYAWVRHGKLKPYKIQSRVYFLHQDIQQLLSPEQK